MDKIELSNELLYNALTPKEKRNDKRTVVVWNYKPAYLRLQINNGERNQLMHLNLLGKKEPCAIQNLHSFVVESVSVISRNIVSVTNRS